VGDGVAADVYECDAGAWACCRKELLAEVEEFEEFGVEGAEEDDVEGGGHGWLRGGGRHEAVVMRSMSEFPSSCSYSQRFPSFFYSIASVLGIKIEILNLLI